MSNLTTLPKALLPQIEASDFPAWKKPYVFRMELDLNSLYRRHCTIKHLEDAQEQKREFALVDEQRAKIIAELERLVNPATEKRAYELHTKKIMLKDSETSYRSEDGVALAREYGKSPNGNDFGGNWVLRNTTGMYVDHDQYSNDMAERWNLELREQ